MSKVEEWRESVEKDARRMRMEGAVRSWETEMWDGFGREASSARASMMEMERDSELELEWDRPRKVAFSDSVKSSDSTCFFVARTGSV